MSHDPYLDRAAMIDDGAAGFTSAGHDGDYRHATGQSNTAELALTGRAFGTRYEVLVSYVANAVRLLEPETMTVYSYNSLGQLESTDEALGNQTM